LKNSYKLIVAGTRTFIPSLLHADILNKQCPHPTEIVSGGAKGADKFGESWAEWNNIKITRFLPDWNKYGNRAGLIRNIEMADYADGLLAFWDKKSTGTQHMIEQAYKRNLDIKVIVI
jgi:hypothetical protein